VRYFSLDPSAQYAALSIEDHKVGVGTGAESSLFVLDAKTPSRRTLLN
jgi:hypothetical protein